MPLSKSSKDSLRKALTISWLAFLAMIAALVGNLYPVPEGPYGRLPYIFLAYLSAGLILFVWQKRNEKAA